MAEEGALGIEAGAPIREGAGASLGAPSLQVIGEPSPVRCTEGRAAATR